MESLPFLTHSIPSIGGVIRDSLDDFRVEEIPAYLPSGEGDHAYIRFAKRGLTTPEAVERIARAISVSPRECGWAGLKDKHALTTQWASFLRPDPERLAKLAIDGITVLEVSRHKNKLKSGHLHGNRFEILVRQCEPNALATAREVVAVLNDKGVPNYYGAQRFGRDGDNVGRGVRWLRGETPAPRQAFERKMYASSVQSWLFNRYVAERLNDGLLGAYVPGDLAVRHPLDKVFAITEDEAGTTYPARECSASGPMFGPEMRWPESEARAREERVLTASELTLAHFANARGLAEGTRRSVRLCPSPIEVFEAGENTVGLRFELTSGAYATAVLRELRKRDEDR
ncbi:MAG: tRNA pseudouridine(13) synthase TruD [Deltaproteobacteria bacterium]|nr:tRNA pseudouridine(13) synthase TruD [Deltaproteobacteria bacterium]